MRVKSIQFRHQHNKLRDFTTDAGSNPFLSEGQRHANERM